MIEYIENKETGKMELHFSKSDYQALPDSDKKEIKSNFLWSSASGCWVSRCKFPHFYSADRVAEKIGAVKQEAKGERLSFAEQMAEKAERAEARAERAEARAEIAITRGEQLQKPIHDMHGDVAFFTQPNINTTAGRAFTRRREKMFATFERGYDEFRKSEYYKEKAESARQTAQTATKPDIAFCDRRIKDAEKTIRAQERNVDSYKNTLEKLERGEAVKRFNGEPVTVEEVLGWIEQADDITEQAISKIIYYKEIINSYGGVNFSRDNVKPGYIVKLDNGDNVKVVSVGSVNFAYKTSRGFYLTAAFAEIVEIVEAVEEKPKAQPFKAGEQFTIKEYKNNDYTKRVETVYTITKATDKSVTLSDGKRSFTRQPKIRPTCNGDMWALFVTDYDGFYKPVEA